jgi:uncharacterized protein
MEDTLRRIAEALERLSPPPPPPPDLSQADAFLWRPPGRLLPVPSVARVPLRLLRGVERQARLLLGNVQRFADGLPANHALLWGARGMGKSSLVKAVHAEVNASRPGALALIEIARDELATLPELLALLRGAGRRVLLFCDDLSFGADEATARALKSVLEGGIAGTPETVLFVATSNRRHLMPREAIENESGTAIHPGEAVEEKVSLSDRFGLWLGFHGCDQPTFLAMVEAYAEALQLGIAREALRAEALAWAGTRGARSGRVAWQYVQDLAGRLGRPARFPPASD